MSRRAPGEQRRAALAELLSAVMPVSALSPFPRTLVDAALIAKDTVVCCFQNEDTEWCLAVWRGWSARDFDVFYQAYEELGRLETCMRKRR